MVKKTEPLIFSFHIHITTATITKLRYGVTLCRNARIHT